MPTLFQDYKELQRLAELDKEAFADFVENQPDWGVVYNSTPPDSKTWVLLVRVLNDGRSPLWIKYFGCGDEKYATEKLIADYKHHRALVGLPDVQDGANSTPNNTYKVGLYSLANAFLLGAATRAPWYFGILYFIVVFFLWLSSGRSRKISVAILWLMRIIAICSIVAIILRIIRK